MSDPVLDGVIAAAEVIGDRWSLPILTVLADGPRRFTELEQALPGVSSNVLSRRLSDLERAGLLTGRPYQSRPVRLVYELTDRGADLAPVLLTLGAWGAGGDDVVHDTCGTPLTVRWWCASCGEALDEPGDGLVTV